MQALLINVVWMQNRRPVNLNMMNMLVGFVLNYLPSRLWIYIFFMFYVFPSSVYLHVLDDDGRLVEI